jgi:hypothetical protein
MIPTIAKLSEFGLDSVAALRSLDAKRHACLYLSERNRSIESSARSLLSSHFASKQNRNFDPEVTSRGYEPEVMS